MELDFWAKLHSKTGMRIRRADAGAFDIVLSEREWPHGDNELRKSVIEALEAGGFDVEVCLPSADCLVWTPDPEPYARRFLPENPRDLVAEIKEQCSQRHKEIQERLAWLPVSGSGQFYAFLPGWLSLAEIIVEGFEKALAEHPDARIDIQQIKEKLGTLRFHYNAVGPEEFQASIRKLIRWADAASTARCAVTGRQGEVVGPVWLLCLCEEAKIWRVEHSEVFRDLI